MSAQDEQPPSGEQQLPNPPSRRPYAPPKLERLGTIRELTLGLGMNNTFDGASPPGQNKSIL